MASSQSIENNYNGSLFTFTNMPMLQNALMMKQGAYDINKSKLEAELAKAGMFDIAKMEDQEYALGRVRQVDDIVSKYIQSSDLSSDELNTQLLNKIEETVDQPMLNAIVSTKIGRMEEAKWSEARERNDGSYNDLNYSVVRKKWNEYLSDGKTGSLYNGGGGFIPYVDLNKRFMSKEFQEYMKNSGINAEYIVRADGTGIFKAIDKYEGTVDPERLNMAIDAFIGEDGRKQMAINSIGQFGYGDTEESVARLREAYNSKMSSANEEVSDRIQAVKTMLKGAKTAGDKAKYTEYLNQLEEESKLYQSANFDLDVATNGVVDKNKFSNMAYQIYSTNKKQELFNLTYNKPVWKDRDLDDVHAKEIEYQQKEEHFYAEMQYKRDKMDQDLLIAEMKNGDSSSTTTSTGTSGNLKNVGQGMDSEVTKEEANGLNIKNEVMLEYRNAINELVSAQGNDWDVGRTAELEKFLMSTNGSFSKGTKIPLGNGKFLEVTDANARAIQKISDIANGNSSVGGKLSTGLLNRIDLGSEGDVNWAEWRKSNNLGLIPEIHFIKNENGDLEAVQGSVVRGSQYKHPLEYIATKIETNGKGWDGLSDEEKATANYYKLNIVANNAGLSKSERFFLQKAFNREIGSKGAVSLNKIEKNTEISLLHDKITTPRRNIISDGYSEKEVTSPYKDNQAFKKGSTISSDLGHITNTVIGQTQSILRKGSVVVSPAISSSGNAKTQETDLYNKVKMIAGVPGEYKGHISFEQVVKEGKFTDEYKVYIDVESKDSSGNKKTERKLASDNTVKRSSLQSVGVNVEVPEDTPYNTAFGKQGATTSIVPSDSEFYSSLALTGKGNIVPGSKQYYSPTVNTFLQGWEKLIRVQTGDNSFDIYKLVQQFPEAMISPKLTLDSTDSNTYGLHLDLGGGARLTTQTFGSSIRQSDVAELKINSTAQVLDAMRQLIEQAVGVKLSD